MATINNRINDKALFKSYNPSRPAYSVYSPSYNFGEKIQSINGWHWSIPCLNSYYIFLNSTVLFKY